MRVRLAARIAVVVFLLIAVVTGTAGVAAATDSSAIGLGWSGGFYENANNAVQFSAIVPSGYAAGSATWNAQQTAISVSLNVRQTVAGGCLAGGIYASESTARPVDVLSESRCSVGLWSYSYTYTPDSNYSHLYLNLCVDPPSSACATVFLHQTARNAAAYAGMQANWAYTSDTHVTFTLTNSPTSFSGKIDINRQTDYELITGTAQDNSNVCMNADADGTGPGVTRCSVGSTPYSARSTGPTASCC
jgi:hypothetical protein